MSQLLYRFINSEHFSDDPFFSVAYLAYEASLPLLGLASAPPKTRPLAKKLMRGQTIRRPHRNPSLPMPETARV